MKKIILSIGVFGIFAGFSSIASAGYFNSTPLSRCDNSITSGFGFGSENDDVYRLQQFLARAGYLNVATNGYFGPSTRQAVRNFQADNSLSATGYIGEATANTINERMCDADVNATTLSYNNNNYYGYSSGVTYVGSYDPFVRVISPSNYDASIYTNPNNSSNIGFTTIPTVNAISSTPSYFSPASSDGIQSTNITYNPSIGYSYTIVPQPGSLTISTPLANTVYNEGDTVYLSWTTSNLNASGYNILLENNVTGQSKVATYTSTNNASFVLTKSLLDAICLGVCNNNQQGSFRVVITTPYKDIAGITSNFRAAVSPITINRPYSNITAVTITTNKNPVNSGEKFKLYVNTPNSTQWNSYNNNYLFKIHAICPASVQVSLAGVACGQDLSIPINNSNFQEVPVMITNNTYFKQDVGFEINIFDVTGKIVGTSNTTATVSPAPFNW